VYLNQEFAKRSLINDYKIVADSIICFDADNKFDGRGRPEETILMTELCFFNFLTTSSKPVLCNQ